jgi:hypothetical protein
MRKRGMSEAAILAALLVENETRCLPPLPEEQVRAIAKGMNRYQLGSPAPLPKHKKSQKGRHSKVRFPNVEVSCE